MYNLSPTECDVHGPPCGFRVVGLVDQVHNFLPRKELFSSSALHCLHLVFALESLY